MLADGEVIWGVAAILTLPIISFIFTWMVRGRRYIRLLTVVPTSIYAATLCFVVMSFTDSTTAALWGDVYKEILAVTFSAPLIALVLPLLPAKARSQRPNGQQHN